MNRKEAKITGLPRYSGKVCVKHPELNGERYTYSAKCPGCRCYEAAKRYASNPETTKLRIRKYQIDNPQATKNRKSKHYVANKETILTKNQEWRDNNPDKNKTIQSQWKKANRGRVNFNHSRRRAIKKQAIPRWFEKEKVDLVYQKADEWGFQTDHIVPLMHPLVCGLHCWYNLQLLDQPLNGSKGNRHWPDMP